MMRVIRKNFRPAAAIVVLVIISTVVGSYILRNQRFSFPFLDPAPFLVNVELDTAQAVTPGQGQTAQVAGVDVGRIGKVSLKDGKAIVELELEPRFDDLLRSDATAQLRPRTGLKDMYIQLFPGSRGAPLLREEATIPAANTLTDVNLDEILSEFDVRTRDYLTLLANGAGDGLKGRGNDLAEVFERFGPTFRDLGRVNRAVAVERVALRRSITSLAQLNGRLAEKPEDLSELVDSAANAFGAFADEDDRLRDTVEELPPTLRQASSTLRALTPFANELGPTTRELTPAFRALDRANRRVQPFAREATPILRDRIRPFVREARPLIADLRPAARDLSAAFPEVTRSVDVLNTFFNLLAFNPGGRQGPEVPGREEGYLFWLAWTAHQGANLINVDDANSPMRPVFLTGTCSTLASFVENEPELEFLMTLSPLLATVCGNPDTRSTNLSEALELVPGTTQNRAEARRIEAREAGE